MLTVSRVVVELVPKHHPEGDRFLVKNYPEDKEHRQIKPSEQMCDKSKAYIKVPPHPARDRRQRPRHRPNPGTSG